MSRNFKIGASVLLAVLVIGVGGFGWYLQRGVVHDPARVQELAAEIFPVQVPEGLKPEFGTDLFGFRSAFFRGLDEHDRLAFASYPSDTDGKSGAKWEIENQLDLEGEEGWTLVEKGSAEVLINGATHTFAWMTAEDHAQQLYRSMLLRIPGPERSHVFYRRGPAPLATLESFSRLFE